jgi:hypothetical protein
MIPANGAPHDLEACDVLRSFVPLLAQKAHDPATPMVRGRKVYA